MKVLQLCDYSAKYRGNFIETLECVRAEYEKDGNEIFYAFPQRINDIPNNWIKIFSNDIKVFFYPELSFAIIKFFRKTIIQNNIDIVHTHFTDLSFDILLTVACVGLKVKLIKHLRMSYGNWGTTKKIIGNIIYKQWNSILCVSPCVKEENDNNIKSCQNIYVKDSVFFERLDKYDILDRTAMKINENDIVLFTMGYDYVSKGLDLAVEAVRRLRKTVKNAVLLISVSSNREIIENAVINHLGSIPEWIILAEPREDVSAFYNFCDIFIEPSRCESFCYAIIEAAYCKKRIVASDCPGMTSHAKDCIDICWFENGNVEDLVKKIQEAIQMKEFEDTLEKNKNAVIDNYNVNDMVNEIIKIYNSLLN